MFFLLQFSSVQFSHSVMSDSLQPYEPQYARPPCPSPTPRVCSNSCPSSQWCHPTISSSVIPFSSWLQTFPASESFPINQFFASGGQSVGCIYLKYCLVYRCPLVLVPCFIKTILSLLNSLCSCVSEQLTILVWVCLGFLFCSIDLFIYSFASVTLPWSL